MAAGVEPPTVLPHAPAVPTARFTMPTNPFLPPNTCVHRRRPPHRSLHAILHNPAARETLLFLVLGLLHGALPSRPSMGSPPNGTSVCEPSRLEDGRSPTRPDPSPAAGVVRSTPVPNVRQLLEDGAMTPATASPLTAMGPTATGTENGTPRSGGAATPLTTAKGTPVTKRSAPSAQPWAP